MAKRTTGGSCSRCKRNRERNARTKQTVLMHTNDTNETEGLESDTADLLADLLHLADAEQFSFDELLERAREHHEAERHGGEEHGV